MANQPLRRARRIAIVGVPFNSSGTTDGVARAPAAIRRAGLVDALRAVGLDVEDRGDVPLGPTSPDRDPVSHVIAPIALAAMIGVVRNEVDRALKAGRFPIVLGGDCPILLGCLGASALGAPAVLFVDGHEDRDGVFDLLKRAGARPVDVASELTELVPRLQGRPRRG